MAMAAGEPSAKRDCTKVHFYYFGIYFLRCALQLSNEDKQGTITFQHFQTLNPAMGALIRKELRNSLLGLFNAIDGSFFSPPLTSNMYVYGFNKMHATCSGTSYFHIAKLMHIEPKDGTLPPSIYTGRDHIFLEPYFQCNRWLLDSYNMEVAAEGCPDRIQQSLRNEIALLAGTNLKETP